MMMPKQCVRRYEVPISLQTCKYGTGVSMWWCNHDRRSLSAPLGHCAVAVRDRGCGVLRVAVGADGDTFGLGTITL